jgi:hypothetical protein
MEEMNNKNLRERLRFHEKGHFGPDDKPGSPPPITDPQPGDPEPAEPVPERREPDPQESPSKKDCLL